MAAERRMSSDAGLSTLELIRAIAVLAVLLVLTIIVINHYDQDDDKAVAVLTAIGSVLGAVLGFNLGSTAGKAAGERGKEQAVKDGRKRLADAIDDVLGGGAEAAGESDPRIARVRSSLHTVRSE